MLRVVLNWNLFFFLKISYLILSISFWRKISPFPVILKLFSSYFNFILWFWKEISFWDFGKIFLRLKVFFNLKLSNSISEIVLKFLNFKFLSILKLKLFWELNLISWISNPNNSFVVRFFISFLFSSISLLLSFPEIKYSLFFFL